MAPKQLTFSEILGTDPIAGMLFGRWKLRPLTAALFFIVTGMLYAFVLPGLWGYPFGIDGIDLLNLVLVFPAAAYFYAYQPTGILRIYNSVTRFFREEDASQVPPLENVAAWHARPVWWVAGSALGLLSAGFGIQYSAAHLGQFWYSANWLEILFVQAVRFLALYTVGMTASRHIATSMALNKLFRRAQFPLTLDTDRLEVFDNVKKFALEFVGVAAIVGLNLGLQPLLITVPPVEYAVYVTLYFLLAPICFFLPLWEAHRRMSAIKDEMLDKLHRDFQEESQKLYESIASDPKRDSSNPYLKKSEQLTSIKQTIELVSRTPDWPFEGTTVYRLFITVISPFILAILDAFSNLFQGIFIR